MAKQKRERLKWLKELIPHAVWDGLKELYHWLVGVIGGVIVSLIERLRHHYGFLFILGICVAAACLVMIGILIGRRQRRSKEPLEPQAQDPPPQAMAQSANAQPQVSMQPLAQETTPSLIRRATDQEVQMYDPKTRAIMDAAPPVPASIAKPYEVAYTRRRIPVGLIAGLSIILAYVGAAFLLNNGSRSRIDTDNTPEVGSPPVLTNPTPVNPTLGAPSEHGDPDIVVWVNTASGKYYCQDSQYYGKTTHGTYMKQSEAQTYNYQPAWNKVCSERIIP